MVSEKVAQVNTRRKFLLCHGPEDSHPTVSFRQIIDGRHPIGACVIQRTSADRRCQQMSRRIRRQCTTRNGNRAFAHCCGKQLPKLAARQGEHTETVIEREYLIKVAQRDVAGRQCTPDGTDVDDTDIRLPATVTGSRLTQHIRHQSGQRAVHAVCRQRYGSTTYHRTHHTVYAILISVDQPLHRRVGSRIKGSRQFQPSTRQRMDDRRTGRRTGGRQQQGDAD